MKINAKLRRASNTAALVIFFAYLTESGYSIKKTVNENQCKVEEGEQYGRTGGVLRLFGEGMDIPRSKIDGLFDGAIDGLGDENNEITHRKE
jgi:hypothetical protein